MKNKSNLFLVLAIVALAACKKNDPAPEPTPVTPPPAGSTDHYSSVADFFSKNRIPKQTFTVNGASGGSFQTPQGTSVTVPANAFVTQSNGPVTGDVTIEFKDLYKKSDMLLDNRPTTAMWGAPLKSGGEFFIKAIYNSSAVMMAPGKAITVSQPTGLTGGIDPANPQQAFMLQPDTTGQGAWAAAQTATVTSTASNYLFSLYQYNNPVDSGSWCNSDNSSYFSAYPQTTLMLVPQESRSTYGTEVFLLFNGISSMVHVYYDYINNTGFPYYYAPQGLQCTMVAVGVKNDTLYSSFVPITIGSNQSVNFHLTPTNTADFKTQVQALN